MSNQPYEPNQGPQQPVPQQKSSCGCFVWGCLGVLVLGILGIVGAGVGGWWFISSQVEKYTSTTPMEVPEVALGEEEMKELNARIERLKRTVAPEDADPDDEPAAPAEPIEELVLTADEINALIGQNEDFKGRIYVKIEDDQLMGDVSIPADMAPGGKGRYFNASGTFEVEMVRGRLVVRLDSATINDEEIPEEVMTELSKQNLAKDVYDNPEVAEVLDRFETIRVEDGKLILKVLPADEASAGDESETSEDVSVESVEEITVEEDTVVEEVVEQ